MYIFEFKTPIFYYVVMSYKCCFPGCNYETKSRSLIEFHHIHPRELFVQHSSRVTIPLCPTHHKLIFHPDATSGQHAEKFDESMIVKTVVNSTKGKCVIFEDMQGNEHTSYLEELPDENILFIGWDLIHGIYKGCAETLEDAILDRVERDGIFDSGSIVYYMPGKEAKANELLSNYLATYMKKAKSEFDSALEKARNDWKMLK